MASISTCSVPGLRFYNSFTYFKFPFHQLHLLLQFLTLLRLVFDLLLSLLDFYSNFIVVMIPIPTLSIKSSNLNLSHDLSLPNCSSPKKIPENQGLNSLKPARLLLQAMQSQAPQDQPRL